MDEVPTGEVDSEDCHWEEWYHTEVASVRGQRHISANQMQHQIMKRQHRYFLLVHLKQVSSANSL